MSKIYEIFGKKLPTFYNQRLFGLELELEQVDGVNKDIANISKIEEDHSLRDGGREFISSPIRAEDALKFYNDVMHVPENVSWAIKHLRCTERCSIHVHVNVLHLEEQQVLNVLRLYSMLEAGFFAVVDEHRRNNIYCVPLSATSLPRRIQNGCLHELVDHWHKYTAMNAKPMYQLGTLEFRHLQATENPTVFANWLGLINNLFDEGERAATMDITFPHLLQLYQKVFEKPPTEDIKATMMLAYQEDVVNRCKVSAKTLIERIKMFKESAPCAD